MVFVADPVISQSSREARREAVRPLEIRAVHPLLLKDIAGVGGALIPLITSEAVKAVSAIVKSVKRVPATVTGTLPTGLNSPYQGAIPT